MMFQMLYTAGIYRAFPNTEVTLRIYLSLIATNCSGERLFSQQKEIKMSNQWCRRRVCNRTPQKFWFVKNLGKIPENVGKNS